jgi:uncharacterized membrane protein YfcA
MTQQNISILAIGLWLLVGALAGAVVAVLLRSNSRQIVFSIVLGIGIIGLLVLQIVGQRNMRKQVEMNPIRALPEPKAPSLLSAPKNVEQPTDKSRTTDPKVAAREWLDDFLVRQQQKE